MKIIDQFGTLILAGYAHQDPDDIVAFVRIILTTSIDSNERARAFCVCYDQQLAA